MYVFFEKIWIIQIIASIIYFWKKWLEITINNTCDRGKKHGLVLWDHNHTTKVFIIML